MKAEKFFLLSVAKSLFGAFYFVERKNARPQRRKENGWTEKMDDFDAFILILSVLAADPPRTVPLQKKSRKALFLRCAQNGFLL